MVFYSVKSSEKIFHFSHCKNLRRVHKENKRSFGSAEAARQAGYRMCDCCSVVGVRLRKEKKAVNAYCHEHNVSYHLEDGQLHVHTNNGDWRIIVNGKSNRLFLYHINTYQKEEKIPSIIPGFHSQAIRYSTILEYLEYIVQHDAFRRREKKKSERKAKSMRELRRNTRQFHRGTDTRRFNANQLYSIMDGIYL